jgi:hypothetical protein
MIVELSECSNPPIESQELSARLHTCTKAKTLSLVQGKTQGKSEVQMGRRILELTNSFVIAGHSSRP